MNRVVIITGSTKGIGLSVAKEFLNDGDKVVVFSRDRVHVEQAAIELLKNAPQENILPITADVASPDDVGAVIGGTLTRFGKIDIIINNAGVGWQKRLEQTTIEEINQTIDINLKGTIFMCRLIIPIYRAQDSGTMINISSGLGIAGSAGFSVYSASKFGVIGLTESLAEELVGTNIKIQAVLPGAVDTDMQKGMNIKGEMMSADFIGRKIYEIADQANIPQGRTKDLKIDLLY